MPSFASLPPDSLHPAPPAGGDGWRAHAGAAIEREHGEPHGLSAVQCESVVRLIEAAPLVRRRHQFFLWTQGALQSLLPHQLLACGAWQQRRKELVYDAFHSTVLPAAALELFGNGRTALMRALGTAWVEGGGRAMRLDLAAPAGARGGLHTPPGEAVAQRELLLACGIERVLVHGMSRPQRPEEIESLFVFTSPAQAPTARHALHLELLLPWLHATWRGVQALEGELRRPAASPGDGDGGALLSPRECEVVAGLCDGLSNQRIGVRLGISPLTVKNHVQSILRKLGAANRTQAVAHALNLGLLRRSR